VRNLYQILCEKGIYYQREVFRDGEGGGSRDEEKFKMRKQNFYFAPTLIISILLGIILPLALGVRDPMLIATSFSMAWVLYAIILLIIVFLIRPGLKIKASRKNGVTVVRYELGNPGKKK
jgi:uncharacterized membrane protein